MRDALQAVIANEDGARANLRTFLARRLEKAEAVDLEFLAEILTGPSPVARAIEELKHDLTSNSLQSADQLFRAASYFNIPSGKITTEPKRLKEIFKWRNQIAHEMDVDFRQRNRNRRPRSRQQMFEATDFLFRICQAFLAEVDVKLASPAG